MHSSVRGVVQDAAGHNVHPCLGGNDEQAALGGQELALLFAGTLREDEQGLALLAGLHRLGDDRHLVLGAADAHAAAAAEEPCQKGVDLEQFLFGEHHHPPAPPGNDDEHRVDGRHMGGRKDVALRLHLFQVFTPLHPDAETNVPHKPCKGHQNII